MRFRIMLALVAVFFCGWMTGCSSEEPPPVEGNGPKTVRGPIKRPPPSARAIAPEQKPAPETPRAAPETKPEPASQEPGAQGAPPKAAAQTVRAESAGAGAQEDKPAAEETPEAASPPEKGVYTVQAGDSLALIAGREDVFGDPLKWPILYQLNRERLEGVTMDERLPERPLPEGRRLHCALDKGAGASSAGEVNWVVNVISSPTADRIDGPAVRLIEEGYPVYISRATVKGQKWMRLRVGFFRDRDSAVKTGKKLQDILGQEDSWPVRIGPEETAEYAAYLKE